MSLSSVQIEKFKQIAIDHLNFEKSKEVTESLGVPEAELQGNLDMAMLDGVVLTLINEDSAQAPKMVTKHPVMKRKNISDHEWQDQESYSLRGVFTAENTVSDKHKRQYEDLKGLWYKGGPHKLIWDHPPGVVDTVSIVDLRFTRGDHKAWSYDYELDLVKVEIVEEPQPESGSDSSTGIPIPGAGRNAGKQPPEVTPQNDGGGGLLGFLKNVAAEAGKVLGTVEKAWNSKAGQLVRNVLAGIAEKSPIGGDLLASALRGDFSPKALIKSALSVLPGGQFLGDLAAAGYDTITSGEISLENFAGNIFEEVTEGSVIDTALDTLSTIPGVDSVLNQVKSGNFDPASLATAFTAGLVQEIGAEVPLLGDAANVVSGWLGDAAYTSP